MRPIYLSMTFLAAAAFFAAACSDRFNSCEERSTCSPSGDGDATGGMGGDDGGDDGDGDDGDGAGGAPASPQLRIEVSNLVRVRSGEQVLLKVNVTREGSFDGAIDVNLTGLPSGVGADPLSIENGETTAEFTISALGSANQGGPFDFEVVARSRTEPRLASSVSVALYITGTPGAPDLSFGEEGSVYVDPVSDRYDQLNGMALLDDGSVLLAGVAQGEDPWEAWVVRLDEDGELDPSFEIEDLPGDSSAGSVALLNGTAVFTGRAGATYFVRRLTDAGFTDSSFGTGGDIELPNHAGRLLTQDDTLVVVYGYDKIAKYSETGSPDTTFSYAPHRNISAGGVDSTGRLILGYVGGSGPEIARVLPSGSFDEEFGASGLFSSALPDGHDEPRVADLAVDANSNIYALTSTNFGGIYQHELRLIKVTVLGTLESDFGEDGHALVSSEGYPEQVARDADGGFVVLYGTPVDSSLTQKLGRWTSNGLVATEFGTDGTFELESVPDFGYARHLEVDTKANRAVVCAASRVDDGIICTRIWL